MYKDLMDKLMLQQDLDRADLFQMISDVVTETMTAVQIMGFQMAFLMKEPTPQELAWYIQAMQAHSRRIDIGGPALDIGGTGEGAQPGKLAVGAAILAAAAGIPVVKQVRSKQNSYYSSQAVLAQLGIPTAAEPNEATEQLRRSGTAFLQARAFHPALERTLNEQTEAQIRELLHTVIGPLMNPAATRFVLGVQQEETLELLRDTIAELPEIQVLLLCDDTGTDQICLQGITCVYHWDGSRWTQQEISAETLGLHRCPASLLQTDTPQETARQISGILTGQLRDPRRDVLLANAGAALWLGGKADDLAQGAALAAELIDSGKAAAQLHKLSQ